MNWFIASWWARTPGLCFFLRLRALVCCPSSPAIYDVETDSVMDSLALPRSCGSPKFELMAEAISNGFWLS